MAPINKMLSVALIRNEKINNYHLNTPFNPPKIYPELKKFSFSTNPQNVIYDSVRDILIKLQLNKKNIATSDWDPFSEFISEGDQVLIKPNFVKDYHSLGFEGVLSQITHASILRPIIDYTLLALNDTGNIIIADTPLEKADFEKIIKINRCADLCKFYKDYLDINILLLDLRSYKRKRTKNKRFPLKRILLDGPPDGFVEINLKEDSELNELDIKVQNYYTLADYKIDRLNPRSRIICETNQYHSYNKHLYKIPKIFLNSDVIISVPKLKTHRMAGVTLNLKNMIGICEKIYLPHYRQGSPPIGDAIPQQPPVKDIIKRKFSNQLNKFLTEITTYIENIPLLSQLLKPYYRLFNRKIQVIDDWWGEWHGNDTLWRTILDLNKIVLYADKKGKMRETKQRKYFNIIDGIIGQEGEGPMTGVPKKCGLIIGGMDPVSCDSLAAHIMGYDVNQLKVISKNKFIKKYKIGNYDLENLKISSNITDPLQLNLKFELPKGYKMLSR